MRLLLLILFGFVLAAPVAAQCPSTLGVAVGELEQAQRQCRSEVAAYRALLFHADSTAQVTRARFDSVLAAQAAAYNLQLAALLQQGNATATASRGAGFQWWWWAIPTALGAAALVVAVTHHHHDTVLALDHGWRVRPAPWPTVPHPKGCWPPGHCKAPTHRDHR
jgi:hypothetical protein